MDPEGDPHMNLILSRLVGLGSERVPTIADWVHLIESGFMFSPGKYTDKERNEHIIDFAPQGRTNSRFIHLGIDEAMFEPHELDDDGNEASINPESETFHHGIPLFPSPQLCSWVIG